jgi:hypothetical protein
MRILDPKWTHLADGYRGLQSLQEKLDAEFGRAVRIGRRQKHRKELAGWQKKRRIFFALVLFSVLLLAILCILPSFIEENNTAWYCILADFGLALVISLVAGVVAGRDYIREMVAGRPQMEKGISTASLLEGRWWASLTASEAAVEMASDRGEENFLRLLARRLSDEFLTTRAEPVPAHAGENAETLVLVGPSGVWVFEVKHWHGAIVKQGGVWKQVQTVRGKMGKKHIEEKVAEQAPDDQWLNQAQEIVRTLQRRLSGDALPAGLDPADLIQGGLVFPHPQAILDKTKIQGQTASYGPTGPWIERVAKAPPQEGFTLEIRLDVLDALIHRATINEHSMAQVVSAEAEAQRIYDETAGELRGYVAELVK